MTPDCRRWGAQPWTILVFCLLALVPAGCTGEEPDRGGSDRAVPTKSASAASEPVRLSEEISGQRVEVPWRPVAKNPERRVPINSSSAFDGRYLLDGFTGRGARIVDTHDGRVVVDHRAKSGHTVRQVLLEAPWAIVRETDDTTRQTNAHRYDLRNGTRTQVLGPGATSASIDSTDWDLRAGSAVYATRYRDRSASCLMVVDIGTLATRQRYCAPSGLAIDEITLGPRESATFLLRNATLDSEASELARCPTVYRAALTGTAAPVAVPLRRKCAATQGAGGPDWTVWIEYAQPGATQPFAPVYAQAPDGTVTPVGTTSDERTLRPCGDWVYWQVSRLDTDGGTFGRLAGIVRWKPGSEIELVFETKLDTERLFIQDCTSGWLTFVQIHATGTTTHTARPSA